MHISTVTECEDQEDEKSKQPEMENEFKSILNQSSKEDMRAVQPLIWRNIIGITILHIMAVYMFITKYSEASIWTWIWGHVYGITAGFGITAGAHRLWAHRSYSAKLPLRILLACLFCMSGMTHPSKWIRIHRIHHKFTDTPADPHDSNRGFFFSHVGWLMMKHHPAVKASKVDMSDIANDSVICFLDRYYALIMITLCFIVPTVLPVYVWNETWTISISASIIRYAIILNTTFSVNSFAHMWGYRSYDRTLRSTENKTVSFVTLGEGWHNYHHVFPWDYKAAELGLYRFNSTTAFIDLMAWIGWAYNLKTPSKEVINRTCLNKGDGTKNFSNRDKRQISSG